ncbi:MAG: winged helix-turn-helix domain-containing protein [Aigarchaeota archaeon]|nr:winged helix-turn-helix domain-containing protein [Aigarchaeota archaeon]MCX8192375.1 winged helix-turn-helix domain-containing protein [Nitrososphaeria archaeon]MDW7986956.1 winged helix-turn-helix domain-containing protein [Nitrososphaerota archaeon]
MLSEDEELDWITRYFHALGNKTRLKILLLLTSTERPLHIKAVSRKLKISYPAVYRHIKTMKNADILRIYEVGRSRVVTVKSPEMHSEVINFIKKHKL